MVATCTPGISNHPYQLALPHLLAASHVYCLVVGRSNFLRKMQTYYCGFPDLGFEWKLVPMRTGRIVATFVAAGTHRGQFMGFSPTGRHAAIPGWGYYKVEGGGIIKEDTTYDWVRLHNILRGLEGQVGEQTPYP